MATLPFDMVKDVGRTMLSIEPKDGESEQDFRDRVADGLLEQKPDMADHIINSITGEET